MKPIRRTPRVRFGCWGKIIGPCWTLGEVVEEPMVFRPPKDPGNVVGPLPFKWPNFYGLYINGGDPNYLANYLRLPGARSILLDRGGLLGRPGLVNISSCKLGPLGFHGFPRKKTLGWIWCFSRWIFGGFFGSHGMNITLFTTIW